jgi:hypothetical protein
MENKPNNEISELLARLQQNVEKPSEPQMDIEKNTSEQSAGELLSLLKKNIGATDTENVPSENQDYNIEGYEFDEQEDVAESEAVSEAASKEESVVLIEQDHSQDLSEIGEQATKASEEVPTLQENDDDSCVVTVLLDREEVHEVQEEIADTNSDESLPQEDQAPSEAQESEQIQNVIVPIEAENVLESGTDAVSEEVLDSHIANEETTAAIFEKTEQTEQSEIALPQENKQNEDQAINETADEYADVYFSEAVFKRFFRFRRLKNEQDGVGKNEIFDKPDFDDIDINLALTLGSKEALENSIGYERVRSARNGFYDPLLDEATGDRTYGYCGEEFRSYEQTEAIKKKYVAEYTKTIKQFLITFILSIAVLFWEHLPQTGLHVAFFSDLLQKPLYYYGGAVLFSVLLIACSFHGIVRGFRALFSLHGEPNVAISCISVLGLIYHLVVFIFFRDAGLLTYNFAVALFILFGMIDSAMRLIREKLSFEVVSDRKPKLSLEQLEGVSYSENVEAFFAKQNFFVEKVDFVGNFFSRSGRRPQQFSEYFHEVAYSALGALVLSVFTVCYTRDFSLAAASFMFTMLMCVPLQFLVVNAYPFYHLSKGLSKLGSTVIGDAAAEEYNDADTIYLEDSEMFGKHGAQVIGLRAYNDMDFYEILSYALSVFTLIGAPLCNVFENSAKEIEKKDNVKITGITFGGVEAIVDLFKTVYIGNLAFMRSHGFFPKQSLDDKTKTESGQVSILYMAVGEELCAKFYVQYTVTQRFEKFAAEMLKNGIRVGIRSLDPNVNAKMIATLRNDKDVSIKVIRPTPNDLIPIGKHSESGIVTSKNSHMIFKILEQCFNIKRIHARQKLLRRFSILLGVLVSVIIMFSKQYINIPSLYIAIYQLVWLVPALIYTKSNLK